MNGAWLYAIMQTLTFTRPRSSDATIAATRSTSSPVTPVPFGNTITRSQSRSVTGKCCSRPAYSARYGSARCAPGKK